MKYLPDGRLDLRDIVVEPYELAYARYCAGAARDYKRSNEAIVANIRMGKACGSYDPEPALRWWRQQPGAGP